LHLVCWYKCRLTLLCEVIARLIQVFLESN
jgi:hypothetical protein